MYSGNNDQYQNSDPNLNYPNQIQYDFNPNQGNQPMQPGYQPPPQQNFGPNVPNNFQPNMGPPPGTSPENDSNLINKWPKNTFYVKCLSCKQRGYTRVTRSFSTCGILVFLLLLCLCFAIFPIAFIVFCIDGFYVSKHYCSHCGAYFGSSEE